MKFPRPRWWLLIAETALRVVHVVKRVFKRDRSEAKTPGPRKPA